MSRLRVSTDARHSTTLHGAGGTVTHRDAAIDHFELGGYEFIEPNVTVGDFGGSSFDVPDGIVGASIPSGYDAEFDLAAGHVVLWQGNNCASAQPQWTGAWSRVPASLVNGGLLTFPIAVNGHPLRALLDTGADLATIDSASAAEAGIGASLLAGDRLVTSTGVDGRPLIGRVHRVADITIGGLHIWNAFVRISPLAVRNADALFGVSLMRGLRVWASYGTGQIFFQSVSAQGSGP